jgi:hypothetical protein
MATTLPEQSGCMLKKEKARQSAGNARGVPFAVRLARASGVFDTPAQLSKGARARSESV